MKRINRQQRRKATRRKRGPNPGRRKMTPEERWLWDETVKACDGDKARAREVMERGMLAGQLLAWRILNEP